MPRASYANAQVVLTFHGARGLDYEYIEGFVWEKVQDPELD